MSTWTAAIREWIYYCCASRAGAARSFPGSLMSSSRSDSPQLPRSLIAAALLVASGAFAIGAQQVPEPWPQHSMSRPRPPIETAPPQRLRVPAPAGALVLFDGRDLAWWEQSDGRPAAWRLVGDGAMEVTSGGGIQTRASFGDVRVHVEWASPATIEGEGQDRGNSGVFLMGKYEVQVLDSYRNETYADGQAGAIFGQFPPRVNVSRKPGEWQSYDIEFNRPRFSETGALVSPARMTVRHNGVLIHDDAALIGPTTFGVHAPYEAHADALPIALQDHGHAVLFRNIWVNPLPR